MEALIKSPSEFLTSPMAQDEEEIPANTEVLRHRTRKSDDSDLISASISLFIFSAPLYNERTFYVKSFSFELVKSIGTK